MIAVPSVISRSLHKRGRPGGPDRAHPRLRRALGVVTVGAGTLVAAASALVFAPAALAATPTYTLSPFAGIGVPGSPPVPGPATSSPLNNPVGDAIGPDGSVYITDTNSERVEKVNPSGTLSVIAGTGKVGQPTPGTATNSDLNEPSGVAVDAQGNVYVGDYYNCMVEKITPGGVLSIVAGVSGFCGAPKSGPATSSTLGNAWGVAVDSSGNLYVADHSNNVVEKITPGGTLSVIAGDGAASGATVAGPATGTALPAPVGVAVDAAGNVYVSSDGNNQVDKITPSGTLSIVAGNGTAGSPVPGRAGASPLNAPEGIAVDGGGDLYISGNKANTIEEVTPDGTLSIIAGNGHAGAPTFGAPATSTSISAPADVASTAAGRLYIVDNGNDNVELLTPAIVANIGAPTITGAAVPGSMLSAGTGTWANSPVLYSYQWESCDAAGNACVTIAGATMPTYLVSGTDVGRTLRVVVTAANGGGTASAASAQTSLVATPGSASRPGVGPGSRPGTPPVPPILPQRGSAGGRVSLPSALIAHGIRLSRSGHATVRIVCAATSIGCATTEVTVYLRFHGARHLVVARLHDVVLHAGQVRYLHVRLSRRVLRMLQARHVHRARLFVALAGRGSRGVWLRVPSHLRVHGAGHHRRHGHRGHRDHRGRR